MGAVEPNETIVVSFVNSDGNLQIVTEGPAARCPACGYPERHRVFTLSPAEEKIADGCPSCEVSRMHHDPLPWIDGHGRRYALPFEWDGHCPKCQTEYRPRPDDELATAGI